LWLASLFAVSSFAQTPASKGTGAIRGHVHDAVTQEPLLGANVVLLGTSFGKSTDEKGNFEILNLPPGTYRVQATTVGYEAQIKTDVVIASGKQTESLFALAPSAIELGEVIVKPDYFETSPTGPVSSQSLSNEEIRRIPGVQEDVARAIAVLPGVVQASQGRNDLIVRGGAPSENLYLIGNLEVPNINHFGTQGATGGPLSFVNLDFVRDVTFSTGGFGVRYGDRLSSVLKIELKEGRTDHIGGKATISATQFGLNTEGPLGDKGSFIFSARRSYLDFLFRLAGFGFVPEYWDFLGKATYRPSWRDEFSFLNIGALDDVRFYNDDADQRFDNSRVLGNEQRQYFSSISWQHLFRGGFLNTTLGRTFTRYRFEQSDSLLNPIFQSQSKEGETALRTDVTLLTKGGMEFTAGVKGSAVRLVGDMQLRPYETSFGDSLMISSSSWNSTAFKSAAYSQIAVGMLERLRLTFGGRLDYFERIDEPAAIAPRMSAAVLLSRLTTLTLSVGRYHQAPSCIWIVSNEANRRLKHLRADQIVAGIERLLREDIRLRVEGYVKRYSQYPASVQRPYLVLANSGAGFGGSDEGFSSFGFDTLTSEGEGLSRGVELLMQKRFSHDCCYGILSLAYSKTDFTALDGIERPGLFNQRVIMNLSYGYKPNPKWEFSGKFRFGTGTPYTPYGSQGKQDVQVYNSRRLPEFHSLDVRVDRHWNFDRWNLITYVDIQNIYDRENVQSYRWNEREQKVEGSSGIGILPSIGVSAEF
jgi:hypothetical protein